MEEIINDAAAGTEEKVALQDWMAILEKYLQIRRCITILGFAQGKTDTEASTVWTGEGTHGWEDVPIYADVYKWLCVGIDFDSIIKEAEAEAAEEAFSLSL